MAQEHTERGFAVYARVKIGGDGYDSIVDFTVQESSLATERRVWVGKGENRGHLTEQQARAVRDALTEFLGDAHGEYHTLTELPPTPTPPPTKVSTVIFQPDRRAIDMLRDAIALGFYAVGTWFSTGVFLSWFRDVLTSTKTGTRP